MLQEFQPSLDQLHDMLNFVCSQGINAGFYANIYQIELAVEEILVNIISYAFTHQTGVIKIECTCNEFKQFSIIISDNGYPFNPLNLGKCFDLSAIIETKPVGGYGIFFVLKIIDEIKYKFENGKNILTLVKYYR